MKRILALLLAFAMTSALWAAGRPQSGGSTGDVTIEFIQWWEPELPAGTFRAIMDDFEAKNPGIKVKLISGP
jgi:multiple sugar transport system substrate-binding protein